MPCEERTDQVIDFTCSPINLLLSSCADINEDSGIIYPPESCPDDLTYFKQLKQLVTIDKKIPRIVEMAEQGYKSQHSKCLELRKLLEGRYQSVISIVVISVEKVNL